MVGGVGAGLERDCDILFVPNQSKGLFAVAGHTRRVESGDGGIQREADGVGMQIVGSVVWGNGVREGCSDQCMCGYGSEGCGELLPEMPWTWSHTGSETPHWSWHHHLAASGPGGWTSSHQGQR